MGASSSIIDDKYVKFNTSKKIYKKMNCGCIYSYYDNKLELPYSCYSCLSVLSETKYNKIAVQLFNQIKNQSIIELLSINGGWKTTQEAIIYAKHNNILHRPKRKMRQNLVITYKSYNYVSNNSLNAVRLF